MGSEWRETTLEEIASSDRHGFAMGPFGSNIKAENYRQSGVPVIRGTNLGERGEAPFIADGFVFLDDDKADSLASSSCSPGDLIFVAQGTVGKVGLVPSDSPYRRFVLSQNLMKVTLDPKKADPRFVFYFFRSAAGQHEIMSRVNPTGVPCISKPLTSLRQFGIRLPTDVGEQRAIAQMLGALDDKIELNRRMSQTLESMVCALFKSWFVDFDPVHARSERRDPGIAPYLADLFPDSFEDAEVGVIPSGWRTEPIGQLARVAGGSTPSTSEPAFWENGRHFWATPKDLSALATPVLFETERKVTDAGLAQIGSGLLPAGTVLLSSRAPIGYIAVAEVPVAINQGFIAMEARDGVSNLFLRQWADSAHDEIVSQANGSTFLEISKSSFRPIRVVVPTEPVMNAFDHTARSLYRRVIASDREIQTVVALRDKLLLNLMSGKPRVRKAEPLSRSANESSAC
jgi:type I restriction enzyme S subunit